MTSVLTQAMIVNAAVLVSVLATDIGPARKIGLMRVLRPLIVAVVIVPMFVRAPESGGTGLALELAGLVAGILCGLAAVGSMKVYRSPQTGRPVSRAGIGCAALWTTIIGARAAFSFGCVHWFPNQLVHFAVAHQLTAAALTDALVFMALAMVLTRTLGLALLASRLPATTATATANNVAEAESTNSSERERIGTSA